MGVVVHDTVLDDGMTDCEVDKIEIRDEIDIDGEY